jgi:hypothetical protein
MAVPVNGKPLPLSVIRGSPRRVALLVVSLLAVVGTFALPAIQQPWRDIFGVLLTGEVFAFVFAWSRWAREASFTATDR